MIIMKFKRVILCVMIGVIMIGLTGCENKNIKGNLEDLMLKLYQDYTEEEINELVNMEVTPELNKYFLGVFYFKIKEGLGSEPYLLSKAHSVVLVRLEDEEVDNVEEIKKDIKDNVDSYKWISFGVERENIIVENRGNLLLLVIVENEEDRNNIIKRFNEL